MHARITHIAYYLPEAKYTNEDFFADYPAMGINNSLAKVGFHERRIAAPGETAGDMAIKAAQALLKKHNISPSSIEFLLYTSFDHDYYMPATSCRIHAALGLSDSCGTLDHTHGCSAYVYGLSTAKGLIASGDLNNVLLLTSSSLTRRLHPSDKASRYIFGDGAAATLIVKDDKPGIGKMVFGTDSKNLEKIIIYNGGEKKPLTENSFVDRPDEYGNITNDAKFYMDGVGVFGFALEKVPPLVDEVLRKNNLTMEEADLFIFHQASFHMVNTLTKKMKIPGEKVFNNSENIGNTVASTIPIALADALEQGIAKPGDKVVMVGFGVGLSLAATVVVL